MTDGRQQSLTLAPPAGSPIVPARHAGRLTAPQFRKISHTWICIYFNELAIEVIDDSADRSLALVAASGRQARITLCNARAAGLGVQPGMRVNAALALIPDLQLATRDSVRERQALEKLAAWADRYTPAVSIEAGQALLLDVQASLNIFGGLPALRRLICTELAAQPYRATLSSAATSVAALWQARSGRTDEDTDDSIPVGAGLTARLTALPVESFGWPDRTVQILVQMGVRTLGECVRLPRDGFARRIGAVHLRELDRALGLQPEVREFYRPPKHFRATLDLPAESSDAGLLFECAQVLLRRLDTFLVTRQGAVQALWIRLHHFERPVTLLRIGLLMAVMESSGLVELIRLHFSAAKFVAPVTALTFETRIVPRSESASSDLFGDCADGGQQELGLFEQLRTRLGVDAVHGICPLPDHRPELAWGAVSLMGGGNKNRYGEAGDGSLVLRRPLWLLSEPQLLQGVAGKPVFHTVLDLEDGPERIETGWWDGKDTCRDYYIACNQCGIRLWVFKDRRTSCWYLHGLFG